MTVWTARTMARPAGGRRRDQRGVVALEFALVLPFLLALLLGVTTLGLTYSDHLALTNAVREAARAGSALDYNAAPATWSDSVQTRVQQAYFNAGSDVATSQICVLLLDSAGNTLASPTIQGTSCGPAPASPSPMVAGTCVVKVWAKKPQNVTLGVFPDIPLSIGAQAESFYGRTVGTCTGS